MQSDTAASSAQTATASIDPNRVSDWISNLNDDWTRDTVESSLINDGIISAEDAQGNDYMYLYPVQKPTTLLGQRVLFLNLEQGPNVSGCCANPGIEIFLTLNGDAQPLTDFSDRNYCKLENIPDYYRAYLVHVYPNHNEINEISHVLDCRWRSLTDGSSPLKRIEQKNAVGKRNQ